MRPTSTLIPIAAIWASTPAKISLVSLLLGSIRSLGLLYSTDLLGSVLSFLQLLPWLFYLSVKSVPDEPVLGLVFLRVLNSIINQPEASRFPTTKVSPELENKYWIGVLDIIHFLELLLQLSLRNIGSSRMKNINDLQLAKKKMTSLMNIVHRKNKADNKISKITCKLIYQKLIVWFQIKCYIYLKGRGGKGKILAHFGSWDTFQAKYQLLRETKLQKNLDLTFSFYFSNSY